MISHNEKISLRQYQLLTILNVLGTGIIILPRKIAMFALEDSWASVIIGTFFAVISVILMVNAIKCYPSFSFTQVLEKLFGKPLALFVASIFIIKILTSIGMEIRIFAEMTNQVMLPKTPTFSIVIIMLLVSGYVSSKGLEARGRLSEILIYAVVLFVLMNILLSFTDTDFSNLKPVLKNSPNKILQGGWIVFFSFSSLIYTLLAYNNIGKKGDYKKASVSVTILLGFIMLLVTIISIGKFTATGLLSVIYPVLELMNSVNAMGSFIERADAFIMSFWIFIVFASINAGLYYSSVLLKSIFKIFNHSHYVFMSAIIVFIISILPYNIKIAKISLDYIVTVLSSFFMIFLPIAMIIMRKLRGDKVG